MQTQLMIPANPVLAAPALEQETAEVQVEEPFLKLLILLMNGMQY